eukprot:TRINITY_DN442_c0_g2_i1.p1 TRINITY_DN442_c0_g2~~TRINITY_DN442_c0_g2_i1.p1  ORF type:complete len:250 (-),score=74.39 TRINITY_DN442_c0_g2_i1:19-768(-)
MVESRCTEIDGILRRKAPVLRPKIIPRGYDDCGFSVFCHSEEDRKALEAFKSEPSDCFMCKQPSTSFSTLWSLNFNKKEYTFQRYIHLCGLCFAIYNLENFLEEYCLASKDEAKVKDIVNHFLKTNKVTIENPIEAISYFEECLSLSYSLKVLSSNIPQLKVLDKAGQAVTLQSCTPKAAPEGPKASPSPAASQGKSDLQESSQGVQGTTPQVTGAPKNPPSTAPKKNKKKRQNNSNTKPNKKQKTANK